MKVLAIALLAITMSVGGMTTATYASCGKPMCAKPCETWVVKKVKKACGCGYEWKWMKMKHMKKHHMKHHKHMK